jgi:HemY protein
MRRLFALILLALLLGVGVVAVIETDPGYLLLAYGDYTLESSLWVGLVLLVLAVLAVYLLIAVLRRLLGGQKSLAGWLGSRRTRKASRLSRRGLLNFVQGNWARSRRELLRAADHSDLPLANYLLAAQASARLGEMDKMQEYLAAAADTGAGASAAVDLTRAEILLQAGQYQQALGALEAVKDHPGRHPRVLSLLHRAYAGLADWESLARLLPLLEKHKVLSAEAQQDLTREVGLQLLQRAGDRQRGATLDTLGTSWHKLPAAVRQQPDMIRLFVAQLVDMEGHALAEKTILQALRQAWDPELVRLYGYVHSDNPRQQLARAEGWLDAHPRDAQLFLCLGRLSARDKLWGKARDYFESSYRLQRSPETCAELGRLLSGLGEVNVAAAYFREGLLLRENRLPELPTPEKIVPNPHLLTRGGV